MRKRKLSRLLLSLSVLFVSPLSYPQAELAARVTDVIGGADVVGANGSREPLQRRDEIRVGDRIETANDGAVQIMFADVTVLALRCDSKLEINAFRYQRAGGDKVELVLHTGNLRAVPGLIAPADYRVLIADTVVRVGGDSDFEVSLAEDGTQYFAVYDGAMTIEYDRLESKLGRGADADFGRLEPGFPFEKLSQIPPLLGHSILILPTNPNTKRSTNCAN